VRKALTVLVVGSALLLLASCGNSSARSFVRIVNAAPDAGTIDVTINGNKILTATPYGTGSNYFTEAPGTAISLKIVSSGGVNGSTSATIDTQIGLVDKVYYTIAVVGLTVAPSTFTILQTEDDHTAPAATAVKIRVLQLDPLYHVIPGDPGAVDAYVTPPSNKLNGSNADFNNVTFQSTPSWVSFTVPTDGNLRIRAVPAGNTDPDNNVVPGWDSQTVLFKVGQVRTFVLLFNPAGTPFQQQNLMLNDLN
jgi:hypothetical protein